MLRSDAQKDTNANNNDDMLALQNKTLESLAQIQKRVNEMNQVGTESFQVLQQQSAQMKDILSETNEVNASLDTSQRLLNMWNCLRGKGDCCCCCCFSWCSSCCCSDVSPTDTSNAQPCGLSLPYKRTDMYPPIAIIPPHVDTDSLFQLQWKTNALQHTNTQEETMDEAIDQSIESISNGLNQVHSVAESIQAELHQQMSTIEQMDTSIQSVHHKIQPITAQSSVCLRLL